MTVDEMRDAVGQVRWYRVRAWPYSLGFSAAEWVAEFREYDCLLSINDQRIYLHYPESRTIRPLLLAAIDAAICLGGHWSSGGLALAEWPDSIWVLLDAILNETLEAARHPTILAPLCESILKTRSR